MCCQNFAGTQWRYWFVIDKHPSGNVPATFPRILRSNWSSNKHQLGVHNRGFSAFVLLLLFIYLLFYTLPVTDNNDISHLTIYQVTVYMYSMQFIANVRKWTTIWYTLFINSEQFHHNTDKQDPQALLVTTESVMLHGWKCFKNISFSWLSLHCKYVIANIYHSRNNVLYIFLVRNYISMSHCKLL